MIQVLSELRTELFAYCYDQLGDVDAAVSAVVAAYASGSGESRVALFLAARREIARRDVVARPPAVSPILDPSAALIERVVRELRPHQREVLMLSAVHGLDTSALAEVLEVAPDTAAQLISSARKRFEQRLTAALMSGQAGSEAGALAAALTGDRLGGVLGRLPAATPSGELAEKLRDALGVASSPVASSPVASSPVASSPVAASAGEAAPARGARRLPRRRITPSVPTAPVGKVDPEAVTEPMPKVRGPVAASVEPQLTRLTALRAKLREVREEAAAAAKAGEAAEATVLPAPVSATFTDQTTELPAISDVPTTDVPTTDMPTTDESPSDVPTADVPATADQPERQPRPATNRRSQRRRRADSKVKLVRVGEHNFDWLWEVAGFALCFALAALVWLLIPMFVKG